MKKLMITMIALLSLTSALYAGGGCCPAKKKPATCEECEKVEGKCEACAEKK